MSGKLLIVEDEFIVADNLRLVLEKAGYEICGIAGSVKDARTLISQHEVDLVLLDIYLKGKLTGIDFAQELKAKNIAFVYLSANSNQQVLEAAKATDPGGFLVKPFREKDVLITLDIARYRHTQNEESKRMREESLFQTINSIVTEPATANQKFVSLASGIQPFVPFDLLFATRLQSGGTHFAQGALRIGFSEYQSLLPSGLSTISGTPLPSILKLLSTQADPIAAIRNRNDFKSRSSELDCFFANRFQILSKLLLPLPLPDGSSFQLCFYSKTAQRYTPAHLALLIYLQESLALVLENIQSAAPAATGPMPIRTLTDAKPAPEGIVGLSSAMLHILDLVAQVAPTDTSILLTGESGTGKERIAESIHQQSRRNSSPLVKINCAALSPSLIESELFGHEKGAFTGAAERKPGKFELASGGTVFLDEVGELPPEQQAKLLRVLQEREVERLGGSHPIKVDVRVVAATNRNLEKEVAEGRFRLDLYYRLNVFPILLPALRERRDDIGLLAGHFANRFARKMNKAFPGLSREMLLQLEAYDWPGNIRELENVMEQACILNDGLSPLELKSTLPGKWISSNGPSGLRAAAANGNSLEAIRTQQREEEKELILNVLRQTGGRIRGSRGAAELLAQKPTTLESRILKLGIRRGDY